MAAKAGPGSRAEPFYNPGMALDRDLAVAVVRAFFPPGAERRTGWETCAATGVRGLRLLLESERLGSFTLSEASDRAFPVLAANCARYPGAEPVHEDARLPGARERRSVDYVDIDPYGSPLPYLAGALAAVRSGGLLGVTATDMMVLAGAQPSATRRLYLAEPVRGRLGPEGGLRILLASIAREARAEGRSVRCLLGYVGDHHVRAFVSVLDGAGDPDPVGRIDPATFDGPDLGCDRPVGPMWLGPLAEPSLLARLQRPVHAARPEAFDRFLGLVREEAGIVRPFYYEANRLSSGLGLDRPPSRRRLIALLTEAGYHASRTHVRPEGIRTDAPRREVERLAREASGSR